MNLNPLRQWICDQCGEVIQKPEDGYLEWIRNPEGLYEGFKIVHHKTASPLQYENDGCFHYTNAPDRHDLHLDAFIGNAGLPKLLSLVDNGCIADPFDETGIKVANMREYMELFRRLQLPYYEEARLHFSSALDDGEFDGHSEYASFTSDTLKRIIKLYSDKANS
tara:strand:- start:58 stop:552 length:495 start_codon:yes stop_codon:yes gene_type:complete